MLDVYFAPFLETLSDWKAPSVMQNVLDDTVYQENGGNHIDIYV